VFLGNALKQRTIVNVLTKLVPWFARVSTKETHIPWFWNKHKMERKMWTLRSTACFNIGLPSWLVFKRFLKAKIVVVALKNVLLQMDWIERIAHILWIFKLLSKQY